MKRLAVIPSDTIEDYLNGGYSQEWLAAYYNHCRFFDEVYLLSPLEKDKNNLLGMKAIQTQPGDLKRRIKELQVDVVRAYGGNWACRMACDHKVPGVPVIVSVHDTNPDILYDSIKKADVVLCVSRSVERLVRTKTRDTANVWILPNRVDVDMMKPVLKDSLNHLDKAFPCRYKILHVGRLVPQKNLDTLLKALPILGKEYGVLAVGKGDQKYYQTLARELQVDHQVSFIDSIPHEKLAQYFSWCDCMATPSRWEGFGMVFIEALACGAVVVTSDIAPMNEFIRHEENGLLVKDYENPAELAATVKIACTDEALRKQLKAQARKTVESFDRTKIDRMEAEYYQRVLEMKTEKAFDQSMWKNILQWS